MRICFLTDIKEFGGGEVWTIRAGKVLRALGHTVAVAAPLRSPLHAAARGADFELFCYDRSAGSPFYAPFYHFLRRHRIEVVYCTLIGGFWEAAVLKSIARQINQEPTPQRVIVILKTGLPPMPGAFPGFYGIDVGEEIRRLHVVSKCNADAFQKTFQDSMPSGHIEVHREGVDLELFDPARLDRDVCRRELAIDPSQLVLACLGRMQGAKGQDDLLRAAAGLKHAGVAFDLLLAGDGPDRTRLEGIAGELGINDRVRFLGQVTEERVRRLLAASDVLCHASTCDGLPNALVEGAAMQVPIVATAISGIPEIVVQEENGLLVAPHDAPGMQSALHRLVTDSNLRRRLGLAGRRRAEQGFDLRRNIAALADRLQEEHDAFLSKDRRQVPPHRPGSQVTVLFLLNTLRTGGEETEVDLLTQHLDPRRFAVKVMTCYAVAEASGVRDRLRHRNVPVDVTPESLADNAEKVRYIRDFVRREGVRVMVACQDPSLAYAVMQQLSPGECALIEHGGIPDEARRIPKDRTARYIGVSRAITGVAAPLMPVARRSRAITIPSMVDPQRFVTAQKPELRRAYGFAEDSAVILFVGRLDRKKGLDTLVSAAAEVLAQNPKARFVAVGPPDAYQPEYASELFSRSTPLVESGRFSFTGARNDVPELMVAADLLVLPSQGEGMSHVIEEAGAAGLAVIAFEDGAASEQLLAGQAGVLIPPGRAASLGDEILRLIEDSPKRARLGQALRARVLDTSAVQRVSSVWEGVLDEVAAELPWQAGAAANILTSDHVAPFPREIQIQTNTFCNASCVMCPYPKVSKEVSNGRMSEELYAEILAQCAVERGLCRIEPFLMNEPFTDRRMVDLIAEAKRTVPHAWLTVTTNGSLVRPEISDRLIHSGLDAIWFSFNGATPQTFERIMGVPYDRVVANIDYLLSIRPPNLHIFTNMIETTLMAPEIEENIRRWQARGVGSGSSVLVNRGGNVENFDELNYRPKHRTPIRICDLLYHKMYILYNGDVVLCCMDWRRQVVMGNVREQSLREIWRGERYQHYRRCHEEGRSEELDLCRTCSYVYN